MTVPALGALIVSSSQPKASRPKSKNVCPLPTVDAVTGATWVVTSASVAVAYVPSAPAMTKVCGADQSLAACVESQV